MTTRRDFIRALAGASLAPLAANQFLAHASGMRPRHILLRSSWQTVNIGDIGHTPGMLALLRTYLPETQVTLWPTSVDRGVDKMLLAEFPKLRIAEGRVGKDGKPTTPELASAWKGADLLVHGSGSGLVARDHVAAWRKATGKPYGFYGVSSLHYTEPGELEDLRRLMTGGRLKITGLTREVLDGAAFVFFRDTISLAHAKAEGIQCPNMDFGPDATFAINLRDDATAGSYLKAAGLEEGKYLCAIPRLRYTPYHKILGKKATAEDLRRDKINEEYREKDHAKLREAIVAFVRTTGLKVLACPEMTYQIEVAKADLIDKLPEDVKKNVVWRETYWNADEAASVYARALAVASCEMHSPIIAATTGTPALYLRTPTDTCKGQMWRDIGLNEWFFELNSCQGEAIAKAVLAIAADPAAARAKMKAAMEFVRTRQAKTMAVVGQSA